MADFDASTGAAADGSTLVAIERESKPADYLVPETVKDFVFDLHDSVRRSKQLDEMHNLYQFKFHELTERYFKQTQWPSVESIANQCGEDDLFLCLYREMAIRHAFDKLQPTIEQRIESWYNYKNLFDKLLSLEDTDLLLTKGWAYDIMAEFIYQFQSFCQYRTKLANKSREEIEALENARDAWNVATFHRYLRRIVGISNVREILRAQQAGEAVPAATPTETIVHLGFFAIVGLSRVECLLGDYQGALSVLEHVDLGARRGLHTSSILCHIGLFFHVGFSYLMLRRYKDAIRTLNDMVVHIQRNSRNYQRSGMGEQVSKWNNKMLALLCIATSLCPSVRIDEQVTSLMHEKYQNKLTAMQRGEESPFEDLFDSACPKFIVPSIPNYDNPVNVNQQAYQLQVRVFMQDVRQQLHLPEIRSYLKLYTTISVSKLARFREMDDAEFLSQLFSTKHKTMQYERPTKQGGGAGGRHNNRGAPAGPLQAGDLCSVSDVHFYVQGEDIHVDADSWRHKARYGQYFMNQIGKCEDLIGDVGALDMSVLTTTVTAAAQAQIAEEEKRG